MSGIIIPTLIIIGMLPVALQIRYEEGSFSVTGHVLYIPLHGRRKESGSRFGKGAISRVEKLLSRPNRKIILKNAYTTLKRLMPRVRIPYLKVYILAAAKDPANAAMLYGAAGMFLDWVRIAVYSRVNKPDLHADVDFQKERTELVACARINLYIYQVLWAGFGFGWGVWRDHRTMHKRSMSTYDKSAPWRHDGRYHGQDSDDGRGQYRNRDAYHHH